MPQRSAGRGRLALAAVVGALLVSCGGLPDGLREDAERLNARIDEGVKEVEAKRSELESLLAAEDREHLAVYAERESWRRRFAEASAELADARTTFDDKASPLLERNEAESEAALRAVLKQVQDDVRRAGTLAGEPARRAEVLSDVAVRGPELVVAASASLAVLGPKVDTVQVRADEAAGDYPPKADDLAGRVAAIRKAQSNATAALGRAEAELPRLEAGAADLAVLADAVTEIGEQVAVGEAAISDLTTKADELYRSYSKTLIDMRESYVASIGRTSWNEYYDFPTEHEYKYRREIDLDTATALSEWGNKTIATHRSYNVPSAVWQALAIDPIERFPRGDNAAELWLDDIETRYFHRYMLVEGDRKREGEWEEVSEELFEAHIEDLGMDILSKPYGTYEEEALTQAAPAGLAYVGDPRYGKWQNDEQGRRHWSWGNNFLFYYLMFGGGRRHYYYYDDWNRWQGGYRGSRPYYGGSGDRASRRYGTAGSATLGSARYASSRYAKSGGFKRQDRSFRGAGPGGRGGGSGGRGK